MIKKILVPMDGSRQSSKALDWGIDLAQKYNSEIVILRVVTLSMLDIAWSTPSGGGPVIKLDFLKEAEKHDRKTMSRVRKYLDDKVKIAKGQKVNASYRIMIGDPADSINSCSKKEKVDLIVMNTHGQGWFKRALMGSVTDEVIKTSSIPVMVIRPKTKKKK